MRYSRTLTDNAKAKALELLKDHTGPNADVLKGMVNGTPAHIQAAILNVEVEKIYSARRRWAQVLSVLAGEVWKTREGRPEGTFSTGEVAEILGLSGPQMTWALKRTDLP